MTGTTFTAERIEAGTPIPGDPGRATTATYVMVGLHSAPQTEERAREVAETVLSSGEAIGKITRVTAGPTFWRCRVTGASKAS